MTPLHRVLRRRLHPLKLAVVALVFVTVVLLMQWEVGSSGPAQDLRQEDRQQDPGVKRDSVLGLVMGAVNNLMPKMQIRAPDRRPGPGGRRACSPGRYSASELRPALERPTQDPRAPGASGKAFHTDPLTPQEQKEKEQGEEKHCFNLYASDRISLSRDLGPDTRPPE